VTQENAASSLLQYLTRIAREVSRGKRPDPHPLFELTKEGIYPAPICDLAESFGMMLIKIEAREFSLRRAIECLQKNNRELQSTTAHLQHQNRCLKKHLRARAAPYCLVGHSVAMQQVIASVEKIADTPLSVLVEGETGTGKEVVAKAIHYNSSRAEFPFVALNCAALPETLLESELFGIEKGVATGVTQRMGRIEQAHRGTLFLDEIGDMPLESQAKLLRVIEQREVERIGSRRSQAVDVRIIAATNKNLHDEVNARRFRADLYYRLNVVTLRIPPLRERREDVAILAKFFAEASCVSMRRRRISFSDEAIQLLEQYEWPGNIRELRNEVERCVALATSSVIYPEDLSEKIRQKTLLANPTEPPNLDPAAPCSLEAVERETIARVLKHTNNNKSKAARLLGISREGLRRKLLRYGFADIK